MTMATIFAETRQLPHIPKVVQELIEAFRDEDANADEISRKVALDQALTAKVLRMANSAHYGLSRQIASPQDAVVVLGLASLRTMVLASGVTSAIQTPARFDQKAFWNEAFTVGSLCKWLARFMPECDKETAFTCGMLHSIGYALIHIVMPEEAAKIDEATRQGSKQHEAEAELLGVTSAEVGAELARRWKFPEEMQQAVADQNNPDLELPYSNLGGLVYIAKFLNHAHRHDYTEEEVVKAFPVQTARQIGLNLREIRSVLKECENLESGFEEIIGD